MIRKDYLDWENYFMELSILTSKKSKDEKTQTGACIIDNKNRIIGIGYNGFPRGVKDKKNRWSDENDKDLINSKHSYVIHAEMNAIFNSNLKDIENSTLYVTLFPCIECSKAIIQTGIKKVVYLNKKKHKLEENKICEIMFKESKVKFVKFNK